jgi:ABC-2 type transport system permease protein
MTALRTGLSRAVFETRTYFRRGDQVFFTFLFPVMMLVIFATAFSSQDFGPNMTAAAFYLPGMIAAGLLTTGVQHLAVDIAGERGDGTLKRLAGTPLSPSAYFVGKIAQSAITGALQTALLLAVARFAFGVDLPASASAWRTFAWVWALGLVTCVLLGIALAQLPRSAKSASAVVMPIVLVLQFISGVYLPFSQLPAWLQHVAAVFPLKWLAQGMRAVFLPDSYAQLEPGSAWNLGGTAIALTIWLAAGFVVVRLVFRWIRKN